MTIPDNNTDYDIFEDEETEIILYQREQEFVKSIEKQNISYADENDTNYRQKYYCCYCNSDYYIYS